MRCEEFYRKIESDKDWACRLSNKTLRDIANYIDLANEFELRGIPKEVTNVTLSENATRPLFERRNADVKDKVISSLENALNDIQENGKTRKIGDRFKSKITQRDVIKELQNEHLEAKKEENPYYYDLSNDCSIDWFTGDYASQLSHLRDVDLILTDPPYGPQFGKKEWDLLGQFASHVLADGGYLIFYRGQMQAKNVFTTLPNYLTHDWEFAVRHKKEARIWGKKIWNCWKPRGIQKRRT